MVAVFFREDDLVFRNFPVNAQIRIVPCDCPFGFRTIEVVALVLEDHLVTQHAESVRESLRYEKLPVVVLREFDRHVFSESL